ncbi:MAG TPA: hypothetical protein VFF06_14915 [Polyangia bacterium]|nr:hypothetical protein [Polyangia bacterium]
MKRSIPPFTASICCSSLLTCSSEGISFVPFCMVHPFGLVEVDDLGRNDQPVGLIDRYFRAIDRYFRAIDRYFRAIDRYLRAIDRYFRAIDRCFRAIDRPAGLKRLSAELHVPRFDESLMPTATRFVSGHRLGILRAARSLDFTRQFAQHAQSKPHQCPLARKTLRAG